MPNPYQLALAALSAVVVPGVRRTYPANAPPVVLSRASLPCLIALPGDGLERETALFARRAEGFTDLTLSTSPRETTAHALHLLLIARDTTGPARTHAIRQLATLTDAYLAALAADPLLSGRLERPTAFQMEQGIVRYAERRYIGCTFRHTWHLLVTEAT